MCDLDLPLPRALFQIGDRRAQGGARVIGIECRARQAELGLDIFKAGFEVGHQQIGQLVARPKELRQVTSPLEVRNSLEAGW